MITTVASKGNCEIHDYFIPTGVRHAIYTKNTKKTSLILYLHGQLRRNHWENIISLPLGMQHYKGSSVDDSTVCNMSD